MFSPFHEFLRLTETKRDKIVYDLVTAGIIYYNEKSPRKFLKDCRTQHKGKARKIMSYVAKLDMADVLTLIEAVVPLKEERYDTRNRIK